MGGLGSTSSEEGVLACILSPVKITLFLTIVAAVKKFKQLRMPSKTTSFLPSFLGRCTFTHALKPASHVLLAPPNHLVTALPFYLGIAVSPASVIHEIKLKKR